MRKFLYSIMLSVSVLAVLSFSGCNALENATTSGSKLILISLTGNDLAGQVGSTIIFSDVAEANGGTINDNAVAEVTAALLDPFQEAGTFYQAIFVDQIDVEYSRSDGRNIPGVDVPFAFSQKVSVTIEISGTAEIPFVIVQHNAKSESPLVNLFNGLGGVLKLEAKITIHGKDLGEHRIQPVVGHISIYCANYADEED